jgi:hypothetical protein
MRVRRLAPLFGKPNDAEYSASCVGPLQHSVAGTDFDAWESSDWATLGLQHDHHNDIHTEFDHHRDESVDASITAMSGGALLGFGTGYTFVCMYSVLSAYVDHGSRTLGRVPGDGC